MQANLNLATPAVAVETPAATVAAPATAAKPAKPARVIKAGKAKRGTALAGKAKPVTTGKPETSAPALSDRAKALLAHDTAGFTGRTYAGLSKPRNSGITKAPDTTTSKAAPRTVAQLTERMRKCLSEIATAHGGKSFPLCGIDRGQAAIFLASGFFLRDGDARAKLSAPILKQFGPKA